MHADLSFSSPYLTTLDLLTRALATLDTLDEGIAAAQLSGVIDLVAARIGEERFSAH